MGRRYTDIVTFKRIREWKWIGESLIFVDFGDFSDC